MKSLTIPGLLLGILLVLPLSLKAADPSDNAAEPKAGEAKPQTEPSQPSKSSDKKPRLHRLYPPAIDAKAAGVEAIKQFDTDHDGEISGKELDKCPGLKAAIDTIDPSGKGEITAADIAARIKAWQDSKLGRMSLSCSVKKNGQPLEEAEVKFVPEKFLGDKFKTATGKTDANGMAMLSIPRINPPGVAPGFYRVEITKDGETIPAKYNTDTILGQEVALDAKGIQEGIKFNLDY